MTDISSEHNLHTITNGVKAKTDISHIHAFLGAKTGDKWLAAAKGKSRFSLCSTDSSLEYSPTLF